MLKYLKNSLFVGSIHTCLLITILLSVIIVSCDKEQEIIEGTWTLTTDTSCKWTFIQSSNQLAYDGRLEINKFGAYRNISCHYKINANTLTVACISVDGNVNIHFNTAYLTIDDISRNRLCLSGTIRIETRDNDYYLIDSYEENFVYAFTKH